MQSRGRFRSRTGALIYGDRVVVQSERGVELGEVVFKAKRGEETRSMPVGWVLRRATGEDREAHDALNERLDGPGPEFKFCRERIQALDLAMRLVDVERPFGGGKIIFYFTADGRVDFRMLVRDLAKRFRTRIEMKQIGVRDEAKVLGDVADCGRELCCRTFLTKLQPISMRMAKVQKTTLDPAKISGRCGRLKCCLRYEYDAYLSLRESLPRSGARVQHERGLGIVSTMDILSQMVTVVFDEGERDMVHVETLSPAGPDAPPPPRWDRQPAGRPADRSPPSDTKRRESDSRPDRADGARREELATEATEATDERGPESGPAEPAPDPAVAETSGAEPSTGVPESTDDREVAGPRPAGDAPGRSRDGAERGRPPAGGRRQGQRRRRGPRDRRSDDAPDAGRRTSSDPADGGRGGRRGRGRRRSEGGPSGSQRPSAPGKGSDAKPEGGERSRPPRNRSRSDRPPTGDDAKGGERPRRPRRRPRRGEKPDDRDGGAK